MNQSQSAPKPGELGTTDSMKALDASGRRRPAEHDKYPDMPTPPQVPPQLLEGGDGRY